MHTLAFKPIHKLSCSPRLFQRSMLVGCSYETWYSGLQHLTTIPYYRCTDQIGKSLMSKFIKVGLTARLILTLDLLYSIHDSRTTATTWYKQQEPQQPVCWLCLFGSGSRGSGGSLGIASRDTEDHGP